MEDGAVVAVLIDLEGQRGTPGLAALFFGEIAKGLGKAAEAMKNGDLKFEIVTGTPSFDVKSDDEIGKLEASINGIITDAVDRFSPC